MVEEVYSHVPGKPCGCAPALTRWNVRTWANGQRKPGCVKDWRDTRDYSATEYGAPEASRRCDCECHRDDPFIEEQA